MLRFLPLNPRITSAIHCGLARQFAALLFSERRNGEIPANIYLKPAETSADDQMALHIGFGDTTNRE
jgi:hypothetical protein